MELDNLENYNLPISNQHAVNNLCDKAKNVYKETKLYPINYTHVGDLLHNTILPLNKKENEFSSLIPGKWDTYKWFGNENGYISQYHRSTFSLTHQKGGWDCNRHMEILLSGSVPLMFDINECPKYTMFNYPKKALSKVLELPGLILPTYEKVTEPWFNRYNMISTPSITNEFSESKYNELSNYLFSYSKKYLTTDVLVKYIRQITGVQKDKCFIMHGYNNNGLETGPDYLADQITLQLDIDNNDVYHDTLKHLTTPNDMNNAPASPSFYKDRIKRNSTIEEYMSNQKTDIKSFIRSGWFNSIWYLKSQETHELSKFVRKFYPDDKILYFHTCDRTGDFVQGKWSFRREIS